MGPAGDRLDNPGLAALRLQMEGFAADDVAEAKAGTASQDQEFFSLGMVIVLAARNAGHGGKIAELAAVGRLQHLHEEAAGISVARHLIGELLRLKIAEIGGVQGAGQACADAI